jgi:hypothetical protein
VALPLLNVTVVEAIVALAIFAVPEVTVQFTKR